MKPTKHTPGPWTWWANSLVGTAANGEKSHIVKCEALATANARLIAAAPDLLEALEEFIQCGPNAGHNQDLLAMVHKALAKARGES